MRPVVLPTLVSRASTPKRPATSAVATANDSTTVTRSLAGVTLSQTLGWTLVPRGIWLAVQNSDSFSQAIEIRSALPTDSSTTDSKLGLMIAEALHRQMTSVALGQTVGSLNVAIGKLTSPNLWAVGDSSGQPSALKQARINLQVVVDSFQGVPRFIESSNLRIVLDSTKVHRLLP